MAKASALLKNASNIRDQIATYQDSVQAFKYANSAYTDSALSDYQAYLQSRINSASASGSISGASKALSLTKSLDGAIKANISSSITRENIQVMSGNATLTDKYNTISNQYLRAYSNGDLTLAQSLMSQAYSVNQTIQLQQQQAADAGTALAKATATSKGSGEASLSSGLEQSLKQLNNDIKTTGISDFNSTVKKWVDANSSTLESLGVKLPNQPNYFDVVHGVAGAMYNHDVLAAQAYAPVDQLKSQALLSKAQDLNSGVTTLPTLAGPKSVQEVMQAATSSVLQNGLMAFTSGVNGKPGQQPGQQFVYNPSEGKFVETQKLGTQATVQDGQFGLQPVYSGTIGKVTVLTPTQTTLMSKLGLNFSKNQSGGIDSGVQVQANADAPAWVKNVLGDNGVTNIFNTAEGLQFTAASKNGTGLATYTIISDAKGLNGIAEESNTGTHVLNGEYGFNPITTSPSSIKAATTPGSNAIGGGSNILGGSNNNLFLNGGQSFLDKATGNYQAPPLNLPPIPIAPPTQLPNVSVAAPPPTPTISSVDVAHPVGTVSVAAPAPTPHITSVGVANNVPHISGVGNASGLQGY
jgi:hypothetical protein